MGRPKKDSQTDSPATSKGSCKRKDSRGIVLQTGESQLEYGRYRYRYYDDSGNAHEVTSWRLRPEDPTPDGRKPDKSLREKEKEIRKQIETGLQAWKGNTKVEDLLREYMDLQITRNAWEAQTIFNYECQYRKYIKGNPFGKKIISKVTAADVERFYFSLIENGLKVTSIGAIDRLLNPAFKMAMKEKRLPVNVIPGCLGTVKRSTGHKQEQRHAPEEGQINAFLEYVKTESDYKYCYPLFYVMAWTGIRIGEAAGLCWQCVDFKNELIHIHRTLEHTKVNGTYQYIWKKPKTAAGYREIPMLKDVKEILFKLKRERKIESIRTEEKATFEDLVFLFPPKNIPYKGDIANSKLRRLVTLYNIAYPEKQLPNLSCHLFRHSFTCWLIENYSLENSPMLTTLKYIQRILGHEDASVTLNIYAELRPDKLKEEHEVLKKKAAGK